MVMKLSFTVPIDMSPSALHSSSLLLAPPPTEMLQPESLTRKLGEETDLWTFFCPYVRRLLTDEERQDARMRNVYTVELWIRKYTRCINA